MNLKRSIFYLFFLLFVTGLQAQIEFQSKKWDDILALSKSEKKLIFVDAYAEWCGPCKMMDRQVFTQPEVGEMFNKNFVNAKIDMEKGEGPKLRSTFGVTAYPTLLFVNENGKVLHKVVGYQTVDKLLRNAELALQKVNKFEEYQERYEKGDTDPSFVLSYIEEMIKAEKPTEKFTNEYLRQKENIESSLKVKIAYTGLESLDSQLFDIIKSEKNQLDAIYSPEKVVEKIYGAASNSVATAVQFEVPSLFEETKEKILAFGLNPAFGRKLELQYYGATQDETQYLKSLQTHIKKDNPNISILSFETARAFMDSPNMQDYAKQIFMEDYNENTTLQNFVIGLNLAIGTKDTDFLEKVYSIIQTRDHNPQDKMRITQFYNKAKSMI